MSMQVLPTPQASSGRPDCFGKEWNSAEPECTGGPDANFSDEDGRHVRKRCTYFGICGSATAHAREQALMLPQALLRPSPSIHLPPPPQAPAPFAPQYPSFTPQVAAQQPGAMPPRPTPMWTPPMHPPLMPAWALEQQQRQAGARAPIAPQQVAPPQQPQHFQPQQYQPQQFQQTGPVHYPAQTWQVGNAMPPYLTIPEVQHVGESIWVVFLRMACRGILKALSHTAAHFFDTHVLKGPPGA